MLASGDLVVVNDTRVRPARLFGRRPSGGAVELLLLEPLPSVEENGGRASAAARVGGAYTQPGSNQMAMLGIAATDTQVLVQTVPVQTNAFAAARAGSQSPSFPGFISLPVDVGVVLPYSPGACVVGDLLNCGGTSSHWVTLTCAANPPPSCPPSACTPLPLPTPQVSIYDGTAGVGADPAFVGEYLAQAFSSEFADDYADWRILPGAQNEPHPFPGRGLRT